MNSEVSQPILLVDDEADALLAMQMVLNSAGYDRVFTCSDSSKVLSLVREVHPDIVILDIVMPGVSGEVTLRQIKEEFPDLPVLMATGLNETETAVRCMKMGAHDYILKPIEKERLVSAVQHTLQIRALQQENLLLTDKLLAEHLEHPEVFSEIITVSQQMLSIFKYIEMIAPYGHPILITGETGTGKELIARAIHRSSGRGGEFVAVNVSGLDESVFADTLFGHVKGAYTGASESRDGLVNKAAHGTLFLDEIGSLSMTSQIKLLRLLQEREFLQLGSDVIKSSAVRVVAATCKDLKVLQDSESFRKDLFFRLRLHHVRIPPLRERMEDAVPLTRHFLQEAAIEMKKDLPLLPVELFTLLSSYPFPGNVRELQGMIFDAVSRHEGGVLSTLAFRERLGQETSKAVKALSESVDYLLTFHERLPTFKEAESLLVAEALKRADNNQSVAALLLGISRQAMNQRLRKGRDQEPDPL
ncbi:MAG: sigma-54 dependent transcriptional regulator [Lentisphaerota bacterium]